MTSVSSIVFFTPAAEELAEVLRVIGVPLGHEVHDDEIPHWASELGDVHVAVYPSEGGPATGEDGAGAAPGRRQPGSVFPGFWVDDLDATLAAVNAVGATVSEGHDQMEWGCRFVIAAPGGYAIEVNQAGHCPQQRSG